MMPNTPSPRLTAKELAAVRAPLEQASFLPQRVYSDVRLYELEVERVFRRSWLPLCHMSQLDSPGAFVAREFFGEPVIGTRDTNGELHVLSNVCRHRKAVVAKGEGRCHNRRLVCPYHGWTYGLDGALLAAPQMHRTASFSKADYGLPVVRHEIWQGFVFVNFDANAPALGPQLEELTPIAAPYAFERMKVIPVRRAKAPWNWKVSLENFTEAYHQPLVHPLTEGDIPSTLAVYHDSTGPWSYFRLPQARGEKTHTIAPPVLGMPDSYYRELSVINVYPLLHLFIDSAAPLWLDWDIRGVDDHEMIWYMMVPQDHLTPESTEKLKADFIRFIEPILVEDVDVCMRVGRGVHSQLAGPGRLSWMEKSIHQFQNWLADQLEKP